MEKKYPAAKKKQMLNVRSIYLTETDRKLRGYITLHFNFLTE